MVLMEVDAASMEISIREMASLAPKPKSETKKRSALRRATTTWGNPVFSRGRNSLTRQDTDNLGCSPGWGSGKTFTVLTSC